MSQRATSNFIGTCLLVGTFSAIPSSSQSAQPPSAVTSSLTATVGAVDTEERTLKVITGVGHALRFVWLHVDPACRIIVTGAVGRLGDLKRGDIVRIRYRRTPEGNVATSIETVGTPDSDKG